jgi:hypothetical protein
MLGGTLGEIERVRQKSSFTVNRSLAFVAAFALAAAQPAVTLGAPPGRLALPRPAVPAPRAAAPAPRAAVRGGFANQADFKVPFHIDVQPQPLMEPQRFTLHSAGFNPHPPMFPYRRYGWQSIPGYLWYPALYGPACYASNNFLGSPSEQQQDVTIGSLVDGKSNLLSPPSHNAGFAAWNDPAAVSSSPFTLQVGYSTACGAPSFTNL